VTVDRRNGGWIKTQIEEGGVDGSAAFVTQTIVDPLASRTPEGAHKRAVEEHEVGHRRRIPPA
jgi:hypothetical protein